MLESTQIDLCGNFSKHFIYASKTWKKLWRDASGRHIASESPQKAASILDSCLTRLEQKLSLVYNFNESPAGSEKKYCCPADSCNRSYSRMDRFYDHIRESPGLGHKSLRSIIDETRCLQCNFPYRRPHDLVSHEMMDHKDGYMSRIKAFVQYFRSTPTSTFAISSNVGDEGHPAQNNDRQQPLSSNVRLIDEQPNLTGSLVNPPQAISTATGRERQYAERVVDAGTLETANKLCAESTIRGSAPLPKNYQSQIQIESSSAKPITPDFVQRYAANTREAAGVGPSDGQVAPPSDASLQVVTDRPGLTTGSAHVPRSPTKGDSTISLRSSESVNPEPLFQQVWMEGQDQASALTGDVYQLTYRQLQALATSTEIQGQIHGMTMTDPFDKSLLPVIWLQISQRLRFQFAKESVKIL